MMKQLIAAVLSVALVRAQTIVIVVSAPSTGTSSLNAGLLAYWKMDEASGNRMDSSGSVQTLTDNNTVASTTGKIGSAIVIASGVAEFLSRLDSATLSIGTTASFTFDGWVFPTSVAENFNILAKGSDISSGSFEYRIYHPTATSIRFRVSNGTTTAETTSATGSCPLNTWTYFRATLDKSLSIIELELNNNGTLLQAAMASNGCWDSTTTFYVGNLNNSSGYAGRIDEVGFWKRTLTTTEQADRYNGGSGMTLP